MNLRNRIVAAVAALVALSIFTWPLYVTGLSLSEQGLAQATLMILMPLAILLLLLELSTGGIDSRQLAILAALSALNSVIRMLGAGTAGIETVFFLLIIASYVFGSGFGFLLGVTSMLVSALATGGFGPWLPFQAMAAGLLGLLAGMLPKLGRPRLLLASFAIVASFAYGGLMTMWNWPFLAGTGTSISFIPGAGPATNLIQFLKYELFTGGLLWDAGRAATTAILIWLTAPALIATLNRAATRAGFIKS